MPLRVMIRLAFPDQEWGIDQWKADRRGLHIGKAAAAIEGVGALVVEADV